MLFVGDIASPSRRHSEQLNDQLNRYPWIFNGQPLICNLEGLVCDSDINAGNTPVLYNHSSVIGVLGRHGCKAVCLSNNHSLDLPGNFDTTISALATSGINYTGAGRSPADASKPAEFMQGDKKVLLFNSTWHVLLQHRKNPSRNIYINTIQEERIISEVRQCRELNPGAVIIIYLHWNFDLESLPFPVHRRFARGLIDSGSNLVVGSHSHCIQGGERYKDGLIVYGLGNFFIPWKTYIGGTIKFPDLAKLEMALEWNPDTGLAMAHFFRYENENDLHKLDLVSSEPFDESPMLKQHSPYQGFGEKEYLVFFRKNRRKKNLVPVFDKYNNHIRTNMKSVFTIYRIKFARLLAKHNLRDWNN